MTPTARKQLERQRRKDAGLVRVEVYVRPEDREAVRAFVEKLNLKYGIRFHRGKLVLVEAA